MAFPAETITTTKIGMGPIIVTFNSTNIGRVTDIEVETAPGTYEHMGGSNIQHIYDVIQTSYGTGRVKLTIDEITAQSTLEGHKTTVLLRQQKPRASAKEWTLAAGNAFSKMLGVKATRNGVPTKVEVEITPYGTSDAQTWTLSEDASTA